MNRLKTFATIVVTAAITCLFTSLFWIAAYNGGPITISSRSGGGGEGSDGVSPPPGRSARNEIGPSGLAIPVAGVRGDALVDTFSQARAGGARVHDAIDIMAPAGTPVIAAAPGRVEKLFFSEGGGGITAYVRSDDNRWVYYYAHLQRYAPGIAEGRRIGRGDPIGFVGSTGNASPDGPHLHFAVLRMEQGERWHDGTAVNPFPLLAGRRAAR